MPSTPPGSPCCSSLAKRLTPGQRVGLIVVTLATALLAIALSDHKAAVAPDAIARGVWPTTPVEEPLPVFQESWITPPGHTPSTHSSSTCMLASGEMLTAWFGGIREGASDVALYTARRPAGSATWSQPEKAVDRETAQD
ncbi:MAG: hypothetical protein RIQ93_246, partial [Verrucomicrobiota bacterium]